MKKYILGICAIMLAVALALGVSAFKNAKKHSNKKAAVTSYYYQFSGTHGNESNMSLWIQLTSQADYNNYSCNPGTSNSCKVINTTNSGTHPTSVPLDVNGFPQVGAVNTARVLKQ